MEANLSNYDAVLYPSYTHGQTHPDRLSIIGTLFGLRPAPVDQCRMLELGCGNGTNLVPMAWGLPKSDFVGIDLAGRPIARGAQMITELGVSNIRLVQGDLAAIDASWGRFDYIVAHGLYSWVPLQVQERIFWICRNLLAPEGVAFISYNALPGCHLRNMLREMLLFHVEDFQSPEERMQQARALMRFLAGAQETRDEYRLWMKSELERIAEHSDGHLYHDELAEINEPLYFTQFIKRAASHDLQYLGEADYFEMSDYVFSEAVRQTLAKLARNRILREQYLDFLKCRRFRQTLLCHREAKVRAQAQADPVAGFLISLSSGLGDQATDDRTGGKSEFQTARGARFETDFALGKTALGMLEAVQPFPIRFEELFERALAQLRTEAGKEDREALREALCSFLLQLYAGGIVEFRATHPRAVTNVSPRPVANPVARWQIKDGEFVTSAFHMAVKVEDEIGRSLLSWLDGSLDQKELLEKVWLLLKTKDALILDDGKETAARRKVELTLVKNLEKLARLGLLVA